MWFVPLACNYADALPPSRRGSTSCAFNCKSLKLCWLRPRTESWSWSNPGGPPPPTVQSLPQPIPSEHPNPSSKDRRAASPAGRSVIAALVTGSCRSRRWTRWCDIAPKSASIVWPHFGNMLRPSWWAGIRWRSYRRSPFSGRSISRMPAVAIAVGRSRGG